MSALSLLLWPFLAGGAQEAPSATVAPIPEGMARPTVDGVLDEPAWGAAAVLGPLSQVVPLAGGEPSERTEVRLLADEGGLFLGVVCRDSDPSGIRATQMLRDARLNPDDRIEFFLDTFHDHRNAFWFQIGAAGSKGDALVTKNGSRFNKDFDAIWHGRARITAEGWVAEIEIPAASLNFDPSSRSWGFNFRRLLRRRSEEMRWASPEPRIRFFSIANGGTLAGIPRMDQGVGLDVKPFAVANWQHDVELGERDLELDAGFDVFYKATPSSKLSLSFNTDFAETEVDEQRVNLTRFPLFFPEKRDFFLEDSGNFFFGSSRGFRGPNDLIPFFSRRIGLDADRQEVPLVGAAKLTGQTDAYTYGLLGVQTDSAGALDTQELLVGRLSRNLLEQSDAGLLVTIGDPAGGDRRATYGADFNFRTDAFLGDRNLRLSTFVLRTDTDGIGDQDLAYHASVAYPNDEVDLSAGYTVIERNFDPALGFVRRDDIKKYETELAYRPRLHTWIRQLDFRVRPILFTNAGNDTRTVDLLVRPFGVELETGDQLRLDFIHRREVLEEDFIVTDGATIPEAAYTFERFGFDLESSSHRPISVRGLWFMGEYFDGRRDDVVLGVDWRPGRHAVLSAQYERNDVRLPARDFRIHSARLRANLLFTPDLSWSNFLQWDNESHALGLNSRLRWILEPGREVNLVLNQGWFYDAPDLHPLSSAVVVKLGYTLRL